jgi:hypothetical protein
MGLALPMAVITGVAGCGGTSNFVAMAGPILINGSKTAVTSLTVASVLQLSMTPAGDRLAAGVDWTVTCGGNPTTGSVVNGACGTLAPVHTADGGTTVFTAPSVVPIGTAITITATVTSNPSQSSSTTLTVTPVSIAVALTLVPPTSLNVNSTASLSAQVTNDPSGAGVIWTASCAGTACGSFNPTQSLTTVYTAPSAVPTGGTVTITATSLTDTTKSASATITVNSPSSANPISVSVSPASVYVQTVGSAHTIPLTAFVANDAADAGVDWTVSCGAADCGGVNPTHTASGVSTTFSAPSTVPSGGTVTVIAASTTAPSVTASATANIITTTPIAVSISSAPPPSLPVNGTATLSANVASDPNNLGVDWTASCGSAGDCGRFNLSPAHTASGSPIIYTTPATVPTGGTVTITATSSASTPANPGIAMTTIVALPPSLALTQQPPASLASLAQAPVSVSVANDVAPGGVNWTVQCGSKLAGGCGWVVPAQTASGATTIYTAPPVTAAGTSVTLTATSVADPAVSIASNAIAIVASTAMSVEFIPALASQIQPNGSVYLAAAVSNDMTLAGVDWQVCASGCGFFTITPAIPAIPATTTSPYVPAVPAVTETTVSAWSNNLPILYTAPAVATASGAVTVVAAAHANPAAANSGSIAVSTSATGPALHGFALAGMQPVIGATVSLFASGASGYGSAATSVASAATAKDGSFTIAAGYICPSSSSQMYLVAARGAVGANAANPSLALMTALGGCGALGSATVFINEVTTVASAYAIAPFAANDALTGNSSYLYLGASSGNLSGIENAFAAVNNLVDISTGQARFTAPSGNASPPYALLNTLADALYACTSTAGGVEGDGSACGTLFTATDVLPQHSLYNSIAPSDTLQAAFNIAQHPVTNYGYVLDTGSGPPQLLGLSSLNSPFQPILTAQPNDWSASLNYTAGGGLSSTSLVGSFALDAAGDLWITDTAANSAIEWNAVGAAVSPSTGFAAGGGPIAIDANGYIWTSGNGAIYELTSLGSQIQGSPFGGVVGGGSDMTIDAQGNLWIANGGAVSEFSGLGVQVSPAGGFSFDGLSNIGAVAADNANNIWIGNTRSASNNSFANLAQLSNPGATLVANDQIVSGLVQPQIAADGSGNLWAVLTSDSFCIVPPYGGKGSAPVAGNFCYSDDGNSNYLFFGARGIAIDGAGTGWMASAGGGATITILSSVLPIAPSLVAGGGYPNYLASASLAARPLRVAVDGSGNLWVLLANNTVTEYVGVATPAVTPIALGLQNKKLGAKP